MVLFIGGAGFLTLRGSLSENGELGAAGGLLILLAYLMFTGGEPAPAVRKKKKTTSIIPEQEIEEEEITIPVSRKRGVDVVTPVVEPV